MKILLDVNMSIEWQAVLQEHGFIALHWRNVGNPRASDLEIMAWARQEGSMVMTQDLDFGTILALTQHTSPSVFTLRMNNALPRQAAPLVLNTLLEYAPLLEAGALIMLDEHKARVRVLPFSPH
jgi:predicted nuclease of predicted toxin-antitoxin system